MKNVSFDRLVDVVAMLRSDNGCPWDLAQTHESLKADLIEEAYELIEAIDAKVPKKICDELGDLLMQVMLHSQIATDRNEFSVDEVIENLTEKLVRRHPHVFGSVVATDENEVLENWEEIKRGEDGNKD
ncbi:MAG: MazG family protein, partial [Candidatus Poribacteria bacterium]|nr:MazG family protein [Candidatus Poribacteria bacterium]